MGAKEGMVGTRFPYQAAGGPIEIASTRCSQWIRMDGAINNAASNQRYRIRTCSRILSVCTKGICARSGFLPPEPSQRGLNQLVFICCHCCEGITICVMFGTEDIIIRRFPSIEGMHA